ncbi:MAG: hypothetical protein JEZ11_27305 [Desulfobacterales bacterium]|nr:hypothetical protein [Desulfobacterales bacterium]
MRTFLALVLVLFLLPAIPVRAADALTGTIVSTDQGRGVFHLQPDGDAGPVAVQMRSGRFPPLVRPGQSVTVWGRWSRGQRGLFVGRSVTPGMAGHSDPDPTGVRSRLFKGN